MEEKSYNYGMKIPKARVAVLIGKDGKVKEELEKVTNAEIRVNSKDGDVSVKGTDALSLFSLREIVRAIGRGFNPEVAKQLLKQDYIYEQININDFVKHKNHMIRLKGRVIGSEGKARRTIENLTETHITVYGKTIGIIGFAENAELAKRAVESLLNGSQHATVYKRLERKRREMKRKQMLGI